MALSPEVCRVGEEGGRCGAALPERPRMRSTHRRFAMKVVAPDPGHGDRLRGAFRRARRRRLRRGGDHEPGRQEQFAQGYQRQNRQPVGEGHNPATLPGLPRLVKPFDLTNGQKKLMVQQWASGADRQVRHQRRG